MSKMLKKHYGLTINDAGWDEVELKKFHGDGDTPQEFLEWWAEKYDIDRVDTGSYGI